MMRVEWEGVKDHGALQFDDVRPLKGVKDI